MWVVNIVGWKLCENWHVRRYVCLYVLLNVSEIGIIW